MGLSLPKGSSDITTPIARLIASVDKLNEVWILKWRFICKKVLAGVYVLLDLSIFLKA